MKKALLTSGLLALTLAGCATNTYPVMGGQAHLDCQGDGTTTVVLLAGMGDDSTTWGPFRETLGPAVRTCAWDYPGVGESTGTAPMTAGVASASLNATLAAAGIAKPVVLVGHSIAGLTVRLFVGQHPEDVAGVVLFDPTVSSFAYRYDLTQFHPSWDGAVSSREVDRVTTWPDIPFEILRHDSDVYHEQRMWDADIEDAWIEGQADFARLAPAGVVSEVQDAGHYVHRDQPQIAADAVLRVLRDVE
ncbi:pimeloyl-ACP methyl ester carboxylesterase [Mycetocola sp. CAN_C7]|uniref:alpha/beta fold hydrolase n=1 Tax=Mycetocola sp. CAN_C7 TaxID=2787724 RepID=UPI0018CB5AB5